VAIIAGLPRWAVSRSQHLKAIVDAPAMACQGDPLSSFLVSGFSFPETRNQKQKPTGTSMACGDYCGAAALGGFALAALEGDCRSARNGLSRRSAVFVSRFWFLVSGFQ